MPKQLGPQTASVTIGELGINCWSASRFVESGSRCPKVMECNYPEKKTCKAVDREIEHINRGLMAAQRDAAYKLAQLKCPRK